MAKDDLILALKQAMDVRGWSENRAATELGIVQSTLHRALRGQKMRPSTRSAIERGLKSLDEDAALLERAGTLLRRLHGQGGRSAVMLVMQIMHLIHAMAPDTDLVARDGARQTGNEPMGR